jgi:hypothetical protein
MRQRLALRLEAIDDQLDEINTALEQEHRAQEQQAPEEGTEGENETRRPARRRRLR